MCVICHRRGVRFSVEHVIPEALGGFYLRKQMVCVDCNSMLGTTVDAALVNHGLSKMFRFTHGLRGKATKPPNPFVGEYRLQSDPDRRMQIRIGPGGRLVPYFIPEIKRHELPDGQVGLTISVDPKDEPKVEPMVRRISTKLGASAQKTWDTAKKTVSSSDRGLTGQLVVDLHDFKIGLLKIAYEFALDRIPEYVESNDAKQISGILKGARFDEVERYVNIGDGFDREVMVPFSTFLGYKGVKHYLVLCRSSSGIHCFVHLHGLFSVGATLSNEPFEYSVQIGVNDVEARSFRVWSVKDIPISTRFRPLLSFETRREMEAFKEAERSAHFDYESENGRWKLFACDSRYIGKTIDDVVGPLAPTRSEITSGGMTEEFWLGEEVYLRISASGKMIRLLAVRAEDLWKKL